MRGAESPQRERDPSGLALRLQKSSSGVEPSRRRGRTNAENVAPVDNVMLHCRLYLLLSGKFLLPVSYGV